jgi:hypothetical protein
VFVAPDYEFKESDAFLVVGSNDNIETLSERAQSPTSGKLFRHFFRARDE